MGKIIRTYPTPDTKRANCGPRERAMAVFKYLLDIEPEDASRHPRFSLIVNAFEQQRVLGARRMYREIEAFGFPAVDLPRLIESLESELTCERDIGPLPFPPKL